MGETIHVREHLDLTPVEREALRDLFDREYMDGFGPWTPDAPYRYSPADTHVMAYSHSTLIAHVGFQRRRIAVGVNDVMVAGTGGVLVDGHSRGRGLGGRVMHRAQEAMRDCPGVNFGFLGCRREVLPFYESVGWVQVYATQRCLWRMDQKTVVTSPSGPNLICPVTRDVSEWPDGDIDLRSTPW